MKMKPHEKKSMLLAIDDFRKIVESASVETECINCTQFLHGFCSLWNDLVPNDVKKTGCNAWVFNEKSMPF